jgi:hypothetical protein
MIVPITHELQMFSQIIGSIRTTVNRRSGTSDQKIGPQDGMQSDIDGVLAELAFCKYFNVWPDLTIGGRRGSFDCLVNGRRADVKSTRVVSGRLLATTKNTDDVDCYVLAIIKKEEIDFPGYMNFVDLRRAENIVNLGWGQGYGVEQNQLTKFDCDKTP